MMSNGRKFDCIIVGGGLQAGLIFQALRHYQPDTSVLMIERAEKLFGNHTWSFHASDIPHQSWQWLSRNPITTWQSYSVCFPGYERHVPIRYCSIASAAMRESFSRASKLADPMPVAWGTREVQTGVAVERVGQEAVELADGRKYRADLVIDCRGRASELGNANRLCGFQKFHGFEFEIADQAALEPVLMDARVDQEDGFRFLYVLPLQPGRVLVEDTRFSDYPQLSRAKCLHAAANYLKSKGVVRCELVREETGCLPMPYGGDMRPQAIEPLRGGYAGGWFHAATGYSFPLAIRFAEAIASGPLVNAPDRVESLANANRFQSGFASLLNRMLFRLIEPEQRWRIFARFYRNLSLSAIKRFYAHEFTRRDAARLLVGAPPRGLTPFRFVKSFQSQQAIPCPIAQ